MKLCIDCGKTKQVGEFHRDVQKGDGLRVYCKACTNEAQRAYDRKAHEHSRWYQDQSAVNSAHECGSFVGAEVRP